ncbi:carbohydrate-binding family 9-like protein [Bacteroidota bacterium]
MNNTLKKTGKLVICFFLLVLVFFTACKPGSKIKPILYNSLEFSPRNYVCYKTNTDIIIDGKIDEKEWGNAEWSDYFVDIEGDKKPLPLQNTRVKMMWDESYFYILAEIEETDIWATLTERESVIFYDNDFEVFIDPDGDTHKYYEYEINAYGTEWDLMLIKPYRDGGPAVNAWDINGIKSAVYIDGTINDASDVDKKWIVEIAMPFNILKECAPGEKLPVPGDQWRVNFSRVEWKVNKQDGKYVKQTNPSTGKPLPEFNWVWSPQGLINLHVPEMWAFVQFSGIKAGQGSDKFVFNDDEKIKWALRQIYYQQRNFLEKYGKYSDDLENLGLIDLKIQGLNFNPEIILMPGYYMARSKDVSGKKYWNILPDGIIWKN